MKNTQILNTNIDYGADDNIDDRFVTTNFYDEQGNLLSSITEEDYGADDNIDYRFVTTNLYDEQENLFSSITEGDYGADGSIDYREETTNLYDEQGNLLSSITEGDVGLDGSIDYREETLSEYQSVFALTEETAQIAYVAYYGRPADVEGLEFLNDVLADNNISYAPRAGDRFTGNEQQVYDEIVNNFGTSAEADRLFGEIEDNSGRVNQVYQFAFDRDADAEGLDYWTEQIDKGHVTLASFALEVALGAQNDDIEILNNKIQSADLFSNSIDTPEEINAYQGASAENFGRNWLDNFGDTVSTQEQVDAALDDLVNSDV